MVVDIIRPISTPVGKEEWNVILPEEGELPLHYLKRLALDIISNNHHFSCPDCPAVPVEDLDQLFMMETKTQIRLYHSLLEWAEKQGLYARCAVCPASSFPVVLYTTGRCDHKFCAECISLRNFSPAGCSCCVCDVQLMPQEIQVDYVHTNLAKRLQHFIVVVKKLIECISQ